jgi:hypothetical protein
MRKPHTYRFTPQIPVIAALVALCIYTLTRLGLTIFTSFDGTVFKGFEAVPLALWPEIFVKGFWFDMCVISVLLAPICLYEALLAQQVARQVMAPRFAHGVVLAGDCTAAVRRSGRGYFLAGVFNAV